MQNNLIRYLDKGTSLEEFMEQAEARGLFIFTGAYQCVIGKSKKESVVADAANEKLKELKQYMESHSKSSNLRGHHFVLKDHMFSIYSTTQADGFPEEELSQLLSKYEGDAGKTVRSEMAWCSTRSSLKVKPTALREAYLECGETQADGREALFARPSASL